MGRETEGERAVNDLRSAAQAVVDAHMAMRIRSSSYSKGDITHTIDDLKAVLDAAPPAGLREALVAELAALDNYAALHSDGYGRGMKQAVESIRERLSLDPDAAPSCGHPIDALYSEVAAEGERAKTLHGEPADRPGMHWLSILAEEFGEVAQEVTKGEVPPINRPRDIYLANLRGELVQVASVAMRWLAATDAAIDAAYAGEAE